LIKKVESLFIDENIARKYSPDWSMFTNLNTKEDVEKFMKKNNKITSFYEIIRYENGNLKKLNDEVIIEQVIDLYVNNKLVQTFQCSPIELRELAVGFLLSKEIIYDSTEIKDIKICNKQINVEIDSLEKQQTTNSLQPTSNKIIGLDFSLKEIIEIMKTFSTYSKTFLNTGAAHSTALFDGSDIVLFTEDIARHNAVDKLIGSANIRGLDVKKLAILTSCRISAEIIKKIAIQRIPLIISQSAPSSLAIQIAKSCNISLIGFARNNRLNIYSKSINLTE
jgi:FdhD protein